MLKSAENELIQRYGTAGSQFLIGLRGINHETGQVFDRNKLKISAAINNSKIFKEIQKEYKTFSNYIWNFTENKVIYEALVDFLSVGECVHI